MLTRLNESFENIQAQHAEERLYFPFHLMVMCVTNIFIFFLANSDLLDNTPL